MEQKLNPQWGDILILDDGRVVRFVEWLWNGRLLVIDKHSYRESIPVSQVRNHYPTNPDLHGGKKVPLPERK
jgi:hypothetical protein